MNHILLVIPIIQTANVSSVGKAAHQVIEFESAIEVNVNDFLIGLPELFVAERSDCDHVVETIMLSILSMSSGNVLDDEVEVEAARVLLRGQENGFGDGDFKRVQTSLYSWLFDEGSHVIGEADDVRRVVLALQRRCPM